MFFLRKKKQQKDQGAGLVFRWRGARGHHSGKVLAFLLTSGFFAVSAYAIRIEGLRNPLVSKRTGKVVMLNEDNPDCQWLLRQVEDRSPFPSRWDPAFDPSTMGRITAATDLLEGRVWDYQPSMAGFTEGNKLPPLPSIAQERRGFLEGVSLRWAYSEVKSDLLAENHASDLRVSARVIADKQIAECLPAGEFPLPQDLIADEWFGDSFRFLIGIDSLGIVRGCLPLSGGRMEVVKPNDKQKFLAAWLRRMTFMASDDERTGTRIGVLELQIQAKEE